MVRRVVPVGVAAFFALACSSTPPPLAPTLSVPVQPLANADARAVDAPKRGADGRTEGDLVDVSWEGEWWPAVLLERRGVEWLIHYENYGSEWDEVVGEDRIRVRAEPTRGADPSGDTER